MKRLICIGIMMLIIAATMPTVTSEHNFQINEIDVPHITNKYSTYDFIYVDDDADPSWYDNTHLDNIQDAIYIINTGGIIYVYNGIYVENILIDKSLILIGEDKEYTIIDGDENDITINVHYNRVSITDFTIQNGCTGIYIQSDYNTIDNNILTGNGQDISIYYSSNNCIIKNDIMNSEYGILSRYSNNNVIINNDIRNNYFGISNNHDIGNVITDNTIDDNFGGFHIEWTYGNTISRNDISNNLMYGIFLICSNGIHIYHNNFIDNTEQAINIDSANIWDDGYPSGGNYWSDYDGEDPDGDGIGNTPYYFDDGQDNFPFMNMYQ